MDKYEYKIRAEEIHSLISAGRYSEAVKIADTIDWKHVRNISMLCTISDLYKINRRFDEAKEILLLAYNRYPGNRRIVYSLCELSIKVGEFVQAVEYYKEFVRVAPRDTGRYILQYRLYEAQEVSLEERIAVLEEFKKHDYREKWAYELAFLYHRVGLATECVEEVDEMFIMFADGKYVMKGLELKALHEPLSEEQQRRYDAYKNGLDGSIDLDAIRNKENDSLGENTGAIPAAVPSSKQPTKPFYNNSEEKAAVEMAAARAGMPSEQEMQEYYSQPSAYGYENPGFNQDDPYSSEAGYNQYPGYSYTPSADPGTLENLEMIDPAAGSQYVTPPKPVGYDTVNLQRVIAEGMQQIMDSEDTKEEAGAAANIWGSETQPHEAPPRNVSTGIDRVRQSTGNMSDTRQFTGRVDNLADTRPRKMLWESTGESENQAEERGVTIRPTRRVAPSHYDDILTEERDGQISMLVPDAEADEEQITGQISITDIMNSLKAQQQQRQAQQVDRMVKDRISDMLSQYEEDRQYDLQKEMETEVKRDIIRSHREQSSSLDRSGADNQRRHGSIVHPSSVPYIRAGEEGIRRAEDEEETARIRADEVREAVEQKAKELAKKRSHEEELRKKRHRSAMTRPPVPSAAKLTGIELASGFIDKEAARELMKDTIADNNIREIAAETVEEVSDITDSAADNDIPAATGDVNDSLDNKAAIIEDAAGKTDVKAASKDSTEDELSEEALAEEAVPKEELSDDKEAGSTAELSKAEDEGSSDEDPIDAASIEEEPEDEAEGEAEDGIEEAGEETDPEKEDRELDTRVRVMTPEEKELFGPYIHHTKSRKQIIQAIDSLNTAPGTNNAIVTGEEGTGTINLAKGLIKSVQAAHPDFSGKVAKITAQAMNRKSITAIVEKLDGGALIIQRAADMKSDTIDSLCAALKDEHRGLIVVMEDNRSDMNRLLKRRKDLAHCFNVRVDVEALDDASLVAYAKQYALEKEYAIDNLGLLSLHSRIEGMQTIDHDVTISEVRDIVDEAIDRSRKKTVGHFFDVVFRKRYDKEDMVILTEKDFEQKN
ncbi:tetratricopeptide repeat protein [Butyrivibrio sp. MC2013]|uniref:tetratricopeptide repeat protein n=1 Tax=Butyrivibrio sp. MC2013 TaxID=1280686 RepID=UPI0004220854|nr:hypothetical protein [Butyrivibrio sp. MC2013]